MNDLTEFKRTTIKVLRVQENSVGKMKILTKKIIREQNEDFKINFKRIKQKL